METDVKSVEELSRRLEHIALSALDALTMIAHNHEAHMKLRDRVVTNKEPAIEEEQWTAWNETLGWARDIAKAALRDCDACLLKPALALVKGDVVQLPLDIKMFSGCMMIISGVLEDGRLEGMIPVPAQEGSWGAPVTIAADRVTVIGRAHISCRQAPNQPAGVNIVT